MFRLKEESFSSRQVAPRTSTVGSFHEPRSFGASCQNKDKFKCNRHVPNDSGKENPRSLQAPYLISTQ